MRKRNVSEESPEGPSQQKEKTAAPKPFVKNAFRVDDNLYNRVIAHINMIRYATNQELTKNCWTLEAIQEKLDAEEHKPAEEISGDKFMHVKTTSEITAKIEKRVELTRQVRQSFSKRLWILEAITAKLDRDEQKAKQLLEEKGTQSASRK